MVVAVFCNAWTDHLSQSRECLFQTHRRAGDDYPFPGNQPESRRAQGFCEHLGVRDDLRSVVAEVRAQSLSERDRLSRHDVHERPALLAGEDRFVDGCRQILIADNQARARTA